MHKGEYTIHARPFMLRWVGYSLLAWPIIVLISGVAIGLFGITLGLLGNQAWFFEPSANSSVPTVFVTVVFFFLAIAISIGYTVGILQKNLLQQRLYWAADHWIRWTIGGSIIGVLAVALFDITLELDLFFVMPIFATCLSIAQMFRLRNAVRESWLWVFANLIGGVVFSGVIIENHPVLAMHDSLPVHLYIFGIVAQGFITGIVLLFLFEQKLQPMEPARQHEIEKREPSIWDEAI